MIEDTSEAWRAVASAACTALITKLTPAVIVPTDKIPRAAAPVAPTPNLVKRTRDDAPTAVVAIVAVPPTRVTEPMELAPAAVVEATEVLTILLPAAVNTKLPFVAVIFPSVAVKLVPATIVDVEAIDPGAINVAGNVKVTV